MTKKSIKYSINDDTWVFSVLSKEQYRKIHSKGTYGMVTLGKYKVDFREDKFDNNAICHELWHIHNYYLYLESADITASQLEEISAELFADRGAKILKQARDIYAKLKRKK